VPELSPRSASTTPTRHRPRGVAVAVAVALAVSWAVVGARTTAAQAATLPYQDPTQPVATRVADLLSRMTLDEKIGQMTQAERGAVRASDVTTYRLGSVLSGGGSAPTPNTVAGWADMYDSFQRAAMATPLQIPILYGVDAVHGNNNVYGSTIFPHNIGLGATRDPQLVQDIGRAVAEEVSATGIDWTFGPTLAVVRDDRWGRTYESFSEDPAIVSSMASVVTGLQGTSLGGTTSILATAKHFIGDGGTTGGTDQGNTQISEADLRAIHLPPFQAAIDRGVGSIMVSFSSWNGVKMHGSKYLLTDLLKTELGFTGFLVSDWAAIDQLDGSLGFTAQEVATAINAGLDMIMVPENATTFISYLRQDVQNGSVPLSRIDDAVSRILTKKFELGLFEHPYADRSTASGVGGAAHRALARTAVQESQVILKNDGVLPLAGTGGKVCVAGKNADDIGNQTGGWTLTWQGASGATVPGTTILEGIEEVLAGSRTTSFAANGTNVDSSCSVAIAVVGETPYAEGQGDRPNGLPLDSTDQTLLTRVKGTGVPTVVVLVSGRPLDISGVLPWVSAFDAAWLPGSEGAGVADILFGKANPTGTLPVTWPATATQEPVNAGDGQTPLFALGAGLTYSTGGIDTTAPTAPAGLTVTGATATTATLAWTTATDDVAVTGYDVYRGTTLAGTTSATTYTDSGLTAETAYSYTVRARDAAGNTSAASGAVTARTTSGSTSSGAACTATWHTDNSWSGGFTASVTVTSTGTVATRSWSVTWTWAGTEKAVSSWNATLTSSNGVQTAVSASHNGTLAPSAATTFGMQGTVTGALTAPSLTCTAT
jgi:beta-glucosidase